MSTEKSFEVFKVGSESEAVAFAVFEEALAAAREACGEAAVIRVKAGAYYDVDWLFGPEDHNLTIECAEGEAVLYGGVRLEGWTSVESPVLAAAGWVRADLPAGVEQLRLLVVDDEARPRARWPNAGRLQYEADFKGVWQSTAGGGFDTKPTKEQASSFIYKAGELGDWRGIENGEVTLIHSWDDSLVEVSKVDAAERRLHFSPESGYPPGAFSSYEPCAKDYIVWNVREGMHAPGQWYWDKQERVVYYWRKPGEDLSEKVFVVPVRESAIRIEAAENITLRGLTVTATTTSMRMCRFAGEFMPGAIAAEGAKGLSFENVTVRNVSGWGVQANGENTLLSKCRFEHCGAGGARVEGDGVVVEDCLIGHIGEIYYSAVPLNVRGRNARIIHNEIHSAPYCGMVVKAVDALIEHNLIYDIMLEVKDGSGIYVTYNNDYRNCEYDVVEYAENVVAYRNVVIGGRVGSQVRAFYFDELSSKSSFIENLAVNVGEPVHLHMALDCEIRGNIMIDHGPQKIDFPRSHNIVFEDNVCVAGAIDFRTPEMTEEAKAFPEGHSAFPKDEQYVDRIKTLATGVSSFKNNVFYARGGEAVYRKLVQFKILEECELSSKEGAVLEDPRFKDEGQLDLAVAEDSPLKRLGIQSVDYTGVGRRRN